MGMEDIDFASNGTVSKVTDYGLGPRGTDAIYVTQSGSTSPFYPLYDAHGNMISTLSKQGSGGFAYTAVRTFDAWGSIRRGALTGDPKGRYCANLGHKQDDESGLVYMRARYFEPASGRFLSEDSSRNGGNWFAYASNNPVARVDANGNICWLYDALCAISFGAIAFALWGTGAGSGEFALVNGVTRLSSGQIAVVASIALGSMMAALWVLEGARLDAHSLDGFGAALGLLMPIATLILGEGSVGASSAAGLAIFAACAYDMTVLAYIGMINFTDSQPDSM
jgi:RHS repeat-associated protein